MESDDHQVVVNPYSSAGGGTVLEHQYGATLLSRLLTGDPIFGLGDHVKPTLIRFQAGAVSAVDDLLVEGTTVGGERRWLSIGVRRNPKLVVSEEASVKLIGAYVRVIIRYWPEFLAGRRYLQLAVRPSCGPALELRSLAERARAAGCDVDFRQDVARSPYTNDAARGRLVEFDKIIAKITESPQIAITGITSPELAWRVLAKLSVIELHLEGVDTADRTVAVALLKPVTPDGSNGSASDLFARLTELVGGYAPQGARVRVSTLYADLHGVSCLKPPPEDLMLDVSDGSPTPSVRADALMRGPINAISGLSNRVASAQSAVEVNPTSAVQEIEGVAGVLEKRGFHGHAILLRQQFAKALEEAGHADAAAGILALVIEGLVSQGAERDALMARSRLARLHEAGGLAPTIKVAARNALILLDAVTHPFDDLGQLLDTFDADVRAAVIPNPTYALVLAETALATGQEALIQERVQALMDVARSADDELVRVRIELAVAEVQSEWAQIVELASQQRLEPQNAALVLARYARHLTLNAQPDEAATTWWNAINGGALSEIGDDVAEWLYAVRFSSHQYGPVTTESETHPLAQAMRQSGGRIAKSVRDHYNSALGDLRDQKFPAACESARRALRDAVTFGHLVSEMMAVELLADVFAASGEPARAAHLYVRAGRSEKLSELLERLGDQYVDLTRHLDSPAPWQRHTTYKALVTQADLVADEQVEMLVGRAIDDFKAGQAGDIRQAGFPFGPQLGLTALDAIASLIRRATDAQAREVLDLLEPLVPRERHHYRHTDEGHVRSLTAILDRKDELGPQAASQLLDLLALNESVSQQVMQIARDAIARRVVLFQERLPTLIETSFTAAWLLAMLDMTPPDDSQAVRTAFETLTAPYQEPAGVFSMGLSLGLNAMLVRHMSQADCEVAARAQLRRARDHSQPAVNRGEAIGALSVLSGSVSTEMRHELFQAGIAFAQGLEDGSALDDEAGPAHLLSRFRVDLGTTSLAVPGLQLAAATSDDATSAATVEALAALLLSDARSDTANAVARALLRLEPHPAALPAAALAIHGSSSIRSLAAIRWTRSTSRDLRVGLLLASDSDYHVRISLASAVATSSQGVDDDLRAVREKLAGDCRFSVRRTAGRP